MFAPEKDLLPHPLLAYVPPRKEEEVAEMARDIRQMGLKEAVLVSETHLLDGRARKEACRRADVMCRTRKLDVGKSPVLAILERVMATRKLGEGERYLLVARAVAFAQEEWGGRSKKRAINAFYKQMGLVCGVKVGAAFWSIKAVLDEGPREMEALLPENRIMPIQFLQLYTDWKRVSSEEGRKEFLRRELARFSDEPLLPKKREDLVFHPDRHAGRCRVCRRLHRQWTEVNENVAGGGTMTFWVCGFCHEKTLSLSMQKIPLVEVRADQLSLEEPKIEETKPPEPKPEESVTREKLVETLCGLLDAISRGRFGPTQISDARQVLQAADPRITFKSVKRRVVSDRKTVTAPKKEGANRSRP